MSRIWREQADINKHRETMGSFESDNTLCSSVKWVYFVEVGGFSLSFTSLDKVSMLKEHLSQKTHPSTRHAPFLGQHYYQPWWCKLPKGINKAKNKIKVLKALDKVLTKYGFQ